MKSRLMAKWKVLIAVFAGCAALMIVMLSVTQASGGGKENCGSELIGGGSTMQARAQTEVWSSGWEAGECEKKPTVTYTGTSSGLALEQWGANKGVLGGKEGPIKPFPMFIGTDVAPEGPVTSEGTQMSNMVKAGGVLSSGFPNTMVTVPVAQTAIAVLVSMPKGCVIESGTPAVKSKTLEEEWEKGTVAFKSLITGVTLSGKSCEEVKKEGASLQPILEARSNASGATAGFKRYLAMVGPEKNEFKTLTSTAEKSANTEWPKTLPAGYPAETLNGEDGALALNVEHTAGSIGYVGLADAIAAGFSKKPAELGPQATGYQSFFVEVQNNAKEAKEPEYASPESAGALNCSGAEYKGVPSENEPNDDWSQAIDKNVEAGKAATYPICTLTFDLAWFMPGAPEIEGKHAYSKENELAVYGYLRYIIGSEAEKGGQNKALEEKHYAKLSKEIQLSAAAGLSLGTRPRSPSAVPWPNVPFVAGEGPGMGRPWVATVGDSYISGEAGRWAGNTNWLSSRTDALGDEAYFDAAGHVAETVPGCHRSGSAEAYISINPPLATEAAGVNFACSGAKTTSFMEGALFKPGLDGGIGANKGQTKLLEEYATNHNVTVVVISIGGNNFNFAKIATQCVEGFVFSTRLNPTLCSTNAEARANLEPPLLGATTTAITEAIERVNAAMVNVGYGGAGRPYRIVVQTYPSVIPEGPGIRYGEGANRQTEGGCGFWNIDATWANRVVLATINGAVRTAAGRAIANVAGLGAGFRCWN